VRILLLLVAAALFVGCGGNGDDEEGAPETPAETEVAQGTSPDDPGCGAIEYEGVPARAFCGEGDLEISVAEESATFENAECEVGDTWVTVNAGVLVLGDPRGAAPDYVGISLGNHPHEPPDTPPAPAEGEYDGGLLTFSLGGQVYLVTGFPVFTLEDERRSAEFTAETAEGEQVTGSFTCR
jgi:hypothetical protein